LWRRTLAHLTLPFTFFFLEPFLQVSFGAVEEDVPTVNE
jgi:hypothetical protein